MLSDHAQTKYHIQIELILWVKSLEKLSTSQTKIKKWTCLFYTSNKIGCNYKDCFVCNLIGQIIQSDNLLFYFRFMTTNGSINDEFILLE